MPYLINNNIMKVQVPKMVSVGIDMGLNDWFLCVDHHQDNRKSHAHFRGGLHDVKAYKLVEDLGKQGYEVNVTYEAGRCGFTPARIFSEMENVQATIVPINRIEIVHAGKRIKTDRFDSVLLSRLDPRIEKNLPQVCVPSIDQECRKGMQREKKRIEKNIKRNNNQIISILQRWPVQKINKHQTAAIWRELLTQWQEPYLPESQSWCIEALVAELELFEQELATWTQRIRTEENAHREEAHKKGEHTIMDIMQQYTGIGGEISRTFSWHLGDFHRFKTGKHFSSMLGLVPVPEISCKSRRDQGISKKGDPEIRRMAIEMAWLWIRFQPNSYLTKKWLPKLQGKGRAKRTAIVALARQLSVALYRQVVHGEEIEGATINRPLPDLTV